MSFLLPVRWTAVAAGPPPTPISITPPQGDLVLSTTEPYVFHQHQFNIVNCSVVGSLASNHITVQLNAYNGRSAPAVSNLRTNIRTSDFYGGVYAVFVEYDQTIDLDDLQYRDTSTAGVGWSGTSPTISYVNNNDHYSASMTSSAPLAGYGTDNYVADSYPIPTENVITVGPAGSGKMYTTVIDAYNAASDGDNIVIYPKGSPYFEGTAFQADVIVPPTLAEGITKSVSFWGSTQNPYDVEVHVGNPPADWCGICFNLAGRDQAWWNHVPGVYHIRWLFGGALPNSHAIYVGT